MSSKTNIKPIASTLPFYQPVGREIEVFEQAFDAKMPLLLKGPTGSGKSRFVEHMAAKLGLPLYTVSCHEETSAVDLLGRFLVKGHETVWQDGLMTKAAREGGILYLDEVAEARPDTLIAIHALTDHRRTVYLERRNETIVAPDNFMLVASYNPGYQRGLKELKPSTRQRFVAMTLNYAEPAVEHDIILTESGATDETVRGVMTIGQKIRNLKELGLSESASTRLLIDAATLIKQGLAPRLACQVAIVEPLTDEEDTQRVMNELISAVF